MTKAYYYFYYLVVVFIMKINKRMGFYPESAITYPNSYNNGGAVVGLFTGHNAISIFIAVSPKIPHNSGYLVAIPIMATNYYFLSRGNRGKKIFEEYSEKFNASSNKKLILIVAILYVIATLASTAFVVVSHRLKHPHVNS